MKLPWQLGIIEDLKVVPYLKKKKKFTRLCATESNPSI